MTQQTDYRFPDSTEWLFLALFVGVVFLYEFYQGYSWAAETTATDETCQQEFSTEGAFRWYRYFSQAGCLVKAPNTPSPPLETDFESVIETYQSKESE